MYNKAMSDNRPAETEWGVSIVALAMGFLIGVAAFLVLYPHRSIHRAEAIFVGRPNYQACLNDTACRRKLGLPPAGPRALAPKRRELANPFLDRG